MTIFPKHNNQLTHQGNKVTGSELPSHVQTFQNEELPSLFEFSQALIWLAHYILLFSYWPVQ